MNLSTSINSPLHQSNVSNYRKMNKLVLNVIYAVLLMSFIVTTMARGVDLVTTTLYPQTGTTTEQIRSIKLQPARR